MGGSAWRRRTIALAGGVVLLAALPPAAPAEQGTAEVTVGPPSSAAVAAVAAEPAAEPRLTAAQKLHLLQQHIKFVFVLYQENRSFDHYFGTFPGVDGLFSRPASEIPGFVQSIVHTDGTVGQISPFLIPQSMAVGGGKASVPIYPADIDTVDHSHVGIDNSIDVVDGVARNDRYALDQEGLTTKAGLIVSLATGEPATTPPTVAQKQLGELALGHLDCATIPFLWRYADRFALFDNFHQTIIGESAPNAIALIAGQTGLTQWALHPSESSANAARALIQLTGGEPITDDRGPWAGSAFDHSPVKPPYGPNDGGANPEMPALNQTYATLPLLFLGRSIAEAIGFDQAPGRDLRDIRADIAAIAAVGHEPVHWRWYQEGYASRNHTPYVTHHNGPQFFGYVGDNPVIARHLHGLRAFFSDLRQRRLPTEGGVFYVRGGFDNLAALSPVDPVLAAKQLFLGNDDHPSESDSQIAEAFLADVIDAIADSPYWADSAIIITYDENDGLYDHAPPHIRVNDPEGNPLSGGPRIPAIVISPYAVAHGIVHQYSEHSSIIKFIEELHGLLRLGDLPDERRGRRLGKARFGQSELAPADTLAGLGDLLPAFDNARLLGRLPPLPASLARIPHSVIKILPHYGGNGCEVLHITPTDYIGGTVIDPAPVDFNPRPFSTPGVPSSGNWQG
jgi:phospholipase C